VLRAAVENRQSEVVRQLIENGADINLDDDEREQRWVGRLADTRGDGKAGTRIPAYQKA
jgi:hypothetical protein